MQCSKMNAAKKIYVPRLLFSLFKHLNIFNANKMHFSIYSWSYQITLTNSTGTNYSYTVSIPHVDFCSFCVSFDRCFFFFFD